MKKKTLALVIIGITCLPITASAHSWYSEKNDPVFHTPCCGGHDCATWTILPGELTPETQRYTLAIAGKSCRRWATRFRS